MLGFDHPRLAQHLGSDVRLTERNQPFQADDVVFLAENIGEPPLGHAAMKRHLAAFKSAQHARSAARALAFVSASGRLAHPGTHAAPHALLVFRCLLRCSNVRKIHKQALSSQLSAPYWTISTRCGTFATIPRIAGVSGRSIT